jgi:hypothetical protein
MDHLLTMSTTSFLQLLLLAAIWGISVLFMRIGAPVLGKLHLPSNRLPASDGKSFFN